MRKAFLTEIIAALFILLFVYAAASKLIDYQQFRIQLGKSPMLTAFAGSVAWIIPTVEIFIALLLAIQKFRLGALYASFSLMVMFSAYIIAITRFSEYVPCSCGGVLQKMNWNQHLLFNTAFIFLGISGIVFQSHKINS